MDSGALKYMTLHRTISHTYEVITPRNVYLSTNRIVQDMRIGSMVMEAKSIKFVSKMCFTYPNYMPNYSL